MALLDDLFVPFLRCTASQQPHEFDEAWIGRMGALWPERQLRLVAQMAAWGYKYLPVTEELGIRAKLLSDGGPTMWAELMDELREIHLGLKPKRRTGPKRRRTAAGGL